MLPFFILILSLLSSCTGPTASSSTSTLASGGGATPPLQTAPALKWTLIPGMPAYRDETDIYADARPGMLSPVVKDMPALVYVPQNSINRVSVIDQKTFKVIDSFATEREPQHVTPSWDLKTLYVGNDQGNTLNAVDPMTGKKVKTLPVDDPYNLYFTPDGQYAIVVAERLRRLDFRKPGTMEVVERVPVPCRGVDHMDFSPDGKYLIATCEFSGELVKVDTITRKVLGKLTLANGGMPQDIKLSPDGSLFYVADMENDGMHVIDGDAFKVVEFIPTGNGCHGLYCSRDSKYMYVSNRGEGTVSLFEFATRKVVQKWKIPGAASPDMGGVSADGKVLWLSGRYHAEVYALDTSDGKLLARIKVGRGPHGLCVWPQPGRYSVGHTGILR